MTPQEQDFFCITCDWVDTMEPVNPAAPGYCRTTDPEAIRARHQRNGECPDTDIPRETVHAWHGRGRTPGTAAAA